MTDKIVSIAPAVPGLRGKVDRILDSAWAPPSGPISNPDDSVPVLQSFYARMGDLFNFIYLTPAAGLIGAAIKLRILTHYVVDIDCEDAEIEAFFDVLRVIEREARAQGWQWEPQRENGR